MFDRPDRYNTVPAQNADVVWRINKHMSLVSLN